MDLPQDTRDLLVSRLKAEGAAFVALFGSWARREATKDSDLDILVRFSRPISLIEIVRIERELSQEIGIKVDLLTQNALSPYLRQTVMDQMEVLSE